MKRIIGFGWLAAYIATVYAANWAFTRYGYLDVGFGLSAPAGVLFAGLALLDGETTRGLRVLELLPP